jgi:hypothetical protein
MIRFGQGSTNWSPAFTWPVESAERPPRAHARCGALSLSCRPQWHLATIPVHAASHFADSLLFGLMRQQFAIVAAPEAEGYSPTKEPASRFLVGFDLRDALADAGALGLGERRCDRQE